MQASCPQKLTRSQETSGMADKSGRDPATTAEKHGNYPSSKVEQQSLAIF